MDFSSESSTSLGTQKCYHCDFRDAAQWRAFISANERRTRVPLCNVCACLQPSRLKQPELHGRWGNTNPLSDILPPIQGLTSQSRSLGMQSLSSRSRSPRTRCTESTDLLEMHEGIGSLRIDVPTHCSYCNCEAPHGWKDESEDNAPFYCDYCWRLWKWFLPEDILELARGYPWPRTTRYDARQMPERHFNIPCSLAKPTVLVTQESSLCIAQKFAPGKSTCLVVMTNSHGKIRRSPSRGQHGQIRSSTTYLAIVDLYNAGIPKWTTLHTPNVIAFKVDDQPVDDFTISVVCTGPLNYYEEYAHEHGVEDPAGEYQSDLDRKIQTVLQVCSIHGYENLVFSSMGSYCLNPPSRVATSLRKALLESQNKYGEFSHVTFAIPCTSVRDLESFEAFRSVFAST